MGHPFVSDEELYQTDEMSVGDIFRRTREHYGRSLQDVERHIRIRASQLAAIENNDIEKLPGRVYAIGFVRSYAEYLGLSGDKMVGLFKAQLGGKAPAPELHFPVSAADSKLPPLWLVLLSLAVTAAIIFTWWSFQEHPDPALNEIPPVEDTLEMGKAPRAFNTQHNIDNTQTDEEAPAVSTDSTTSMDSTASTAQNVAEDDPVQKGIILNIRDNSWVEIRDQSGKALVSRVLKSGEQYFVPTRPDLTMALGNAGGVEISADGIILEPLGKSGEVRRGITLDADYLKEHYMSSDTGSAETQDRE